MEAGKSHDLVSASWRTRKASGVIQSESQGLKKVGKCESLRTSFKMCSSPDALHLRQLKQFAAVIAAASVLGKKNQREWENCQKIRAKQMPQISKKGIS